MPRLATGLVGLVALTMAFAIPASAADTETARGGGSHRATQEAIEATVENGVPGVIAVAQEGRHTWTGQSGTADLRTGAPRQAEQRYRVGSITKTFVATVALQLAAEGKLSLDDTVDHWLPGLVQGNGHDGSRITVRQLLQHTSGIYSYTEDQEFKRLTFGTDFLQHRYDTWTPHRIVEVAMNHRPDFAPGDGWHYSDTNYVIAGMVIEKAAGHSYAHEIERRILRPLRLHSTTLPGAKARMAKPSGRAYSKLTGDLGGPAKPGSATYDVTDLNPSLANAAGEIISTPNDLNRFYRTLLSGKLLGPRELKEMTTTVPVIAGSDYSYGLGLLKWKSSCGELWGHSGGIQGSTSNSMATRDGKHALSVNLNGDWQASLDPITEAEFCGK
ncbi:serine hydrolase domain-containing protein [Streptomyces zagrosensis]|uniref:D-alanyl-D-alanine carboxypeptidase n=1 Tax=Streptomyces zagrosensis TaxID=1042984 RepID=A0A7W9QFK7_9ACTN|nr:serine hydrolase domain-containing protein [Streptomyces zagrosensis]MBB5938292.1 D-alanyl-D-alanine carboxypeptidase [Streptomyces zagrosensis]